MVLEQLDSHTQKNDIGSPLTSCAKINSKWIKDLNLKAKTRMHLENTEVNLCSLVLGRAAQT